MPEEALDGPHRQKQRRQLNTRLVIQDCHAMFMKNSEAKQIWSKFATFDREINIERKQIPKRYCNR